MDTLWSFFERQLAENNVFSGGLILMIGGALLAYFRELPSQVWHWIRSRVVMQIDILDREPAFEWIEHWLAQHQYSRNRARALSVRTKTIDFNDRQQDPTGDHRPRIVLSPAPGRHLLFFRGRLVMLERVRPSVQQATQQPVNVRESFNLTIFSMRRAIVRELLEEARDLALPASDARLTIYRNGYSSWSEQLKRFPRPLESVVLKSGVMESVLSESRRFLMNRAWYIERGIPYRHGYLLYGPPGTGKSSAVLAIASALGMDIAYLNLAGASIDDDALTELICDVPVNSILLVEDIDCVFVERKASEEKQNRVTFSGLLNALDGVAAGEGRLLFATTNHREKLDPALIRPGRIDRQIEIGLADRDQAARIFRRFFPECEESIVDAFVAKFPGNQVAMSSLQAFLTLHAESAELACDALGPWLAEQNVMPEFDVRPFDTMVAQIATPYCVGL